MDFSYPLLVLTLIRTESHIKGYVNIHFVFYLNIDTVLIDQPDDISGIILQNGPYYFSLQIGCFFGLEWHFDEVHDVSSITIYNLEFGINTKNVKLHVICNKAKDW